MSHLAKDMTPDVTWKEITPGCNIYEGGTSSVVETVMLKVRTSAELRTSPSTATGRLIGRRPENSISDKSRENWNGNRSPGVRRT